MNEAFEKILERLDEELRKSEERYYRYLDNSNLPCMFDKSDIEEKRVEEIIDFSKEVEVEGEQVKGFITEYEYSGKIDGGEIKDILSGGLLKKKKMADKIKHFIIEHVKKFTF